MFILANVIENVIGTPKNVRGSPSISKVIANVIAKVIGSRYKRGKGQSKLINL
jgi:hypothetical protein